MTFQEVKYPQQLMAFLDENFKYGVISADGKMFFDSDTDEFQTVCNKQWRLRSVKDMLNDGVGHCYDQVEIEREWFANNGFEIKTFWISAYQKSVPNSGVCHTYLLYKTERGWNLFEHADCKNKGIHEFRNVTDAVEWQKSKQIEFAQAHTKCVGKYSTCIKQYEKPPQNITMQEYLNFINDSEDYAN